MPYEFTLDQKTLVRDALREMLTLMSDDAAADLITREIEQGLVDLGPFIQKRSCSAAVVYLYAKSAPRLRNRRTLYPFFCAWIDQSPSAAELLTVRRWKASKRPSDFDSEFCQQIARYVDGSANDASRLDLSHLTGAFEMTCFAGVLDGEPYAVVGEARTEMDDECLRLDVLFDAVDPRSRQRLHSIEQGVLLKGPLILGYTKGRQKVDFQRRYFANVDDAGQNRDTEPSFLAGTLLTLSSSAAHTVVPFTMHRCGPGVASSAYVPLSEIDTKVRSHIISWTGGISLG